MFHLVTQERLFVDGQAVARYVEVWESLATLCLHSMKKRGEPSGLSVDDMRFWLQDEVRDVLKECELRVRDATDFVTAYADGKLTREEANERLSLYGDRWGDPLRGRSASSYKTDKELLAAIDSSPEDDVKEWRQNELNELRQRTKRLAAGNPSGQSR